MGGFVMDMMLKRTVICGVLVILFWNFMLLYDNEKVAETGMLNAGSVRKSFWHDLRDAADFRLAKQYWKDSMFKIKQIISRLIIEDDERKKDWWLVNLKNTWRRK